MDLKEKIRINSLYDIYGELLTEKQQEYFEYYYMSDYSLSEISDILSVSRNAVHMQLKNVVSHLEHYESILHIQTKKELTKSLIERIQKKELTPEQIQTELEKM
ncbi:MAG: hypothetical protein JXB08_05380 [Bacilli bacterium]|nr:hypothetical protein [Bacilli bacterium]MBN2877532.1 hypothetical protein [Bacilli bacterium]